MIDFTNGIHICDTDLWLDSQEPQDLCFVSHAHVDHLGSHSKIISSHPTACLYEQRMHPTQFFCLNYRQTYDLDPLRITLYPAGHILGSAQILIEKDGTRILYGGDIKLSKSITAEPIQVVGADILIMEATYGSPHYLFPDRSLIISSLVREVKGILTSGRLPVIVAYSLGKAQEITKILGDNNFDLVVHNTIYDMNKVYEQFNISFSTYEKFQPDTALDQKVLVIPPYVLTSNSIRHLKNAVTIYMSGWSEAPYPVDMIMPLSDHADFNELIEYVRRVDPREIYVVNGKAGFVDILRQLGYTAQDVHLK
jgi:putative mRNA 3-end processing factor